MKPLTIIHQEKEGTIPHCPYQNCNFHCCQFNQGNYIVMYPGEVEAARQNHEKLDHLELIPYLGGYKAICRAKDTSCCDQGYKPLDCQSYPFFPRAPHGFVQIGLKGKKCPLTPIHLKIHRLWVQKRWERLIQQSPEVLEWIQKVELVGYEHYDDPVR